jgi:ABC-type iron transport system FetAB ATPase subunit/GNAT superfamily N-acetyltransferase
MPVYVWFVLARFTTDAQKGGAMGGAVCTERRPSGHGRRCEEEPLARFVSVQAKRETAEPEPTARVLEVCGRFGIPPISPEVHVLNHVELVIGPGRVLLVVGPSGSGKTMLLEELAARLPGALFVNRVRFHPGRPVIDQIMPAAALPDVVRLLTGCALGEPRLWLRRFCELSRGEQFRARLARAVGRRLSGPVGAPLLCDEFAAVLDERAARAVAYNLRRQMTRLKLCAVVATPRSDLEADLQPDQVIRLRGGGQAGVEQRAPSLRAMSLSSRMHIGPGRVADYDAFAEMHYRRREELGFVDRVFVMREGVAGEPVGIVVYAHSPLELSLRNRATNGRFVRNAERLNREVRILRRLVVVPELRGCGLGKTLVQKTLPQVGTRFVECLANLGEVNPVFERAGMRRIGVCPEPRAWRRVSEELAELGADPLSPEFAGQVARRPHVRRLVGRAVYRWYCSVTRGDVAARRVMGQSAVSLALTFRQLVGSRPVYYLWERAA